MSKSQYMKGAHDCLDAADEAIDGLMDSATAEYAAMDLLRTAVWNLYHEIEARSTSEVKGGA